MLKYFRSQESRELSVNIVKSIEENLDNVRASDPIIASIIDKELLRQRNSIELIASENFTYPAVLEAAGSILTNKYA